MELHREGMPRHTYNKLKVKDSSSLPCFADCSLFQEVVRTKMKEKGTGVWLIWDDIPKSYKDWLVNEVSGLHCFYNQATE